MLSLLSATVALSAAAAVQPSALANWLIAQGYVAVPLRDSGIGHLYATATINGREVEMLIDTGASNTVIDAELAKEMGLPVTPSPMAGAGIGSARAAVERVGDVTVKVAGVAVSGEIYTMDMTQLRAALAVRKVKAPSIVLGGDAMRALAAVLLYKDNCLYLHPSAA